MEKGDAAIQLHKRKLMNADKLEKLCKGYLDARGRSARVDAGLRFIGRRRDGAERRAR
jgi:hypothetical protein